MSLGAEGIMDNLMEATCTCKAGVFFPLDSILLFFAFLRFIYVLIFNSFSFFHWSSTLFCVLFGFVKRSVFCQQMA